MVNSDGKYENAYTINSSEQNFGSGADMVINGNHIIVSNGVDKVFIYRRNKSDYELVQTITKDSSAVLDTVKQDGDKLFFRYKKGTAASDDGIVEYWHLEGTTDRKFVYKQTINPDSNGVGPDNAGFGMSIESNNNTLIIANSGSDSSSPYAFSTYKFVDKKYEFVNATFANDDGLYLSQLALDNNYLIASPNIKTNSTVEFYIRDDDKYTSKQEIEQTDSSGANFGETVSLSQNFLVFSEIVSSSPTVHFYRRDDDKFKFIQKIQPPDSISSSSSPLLSIYRNRLSILYPGSSSASELYTTEYDHDKNKFKNLIKIDSYESTSVPKVLKNVSHNHVLVANTGSTPSDKGNVKLYRLK